MTLGITPLLSVFRNLVEILGFCLLFLCLDRPRLSWKKTCLCYGIFVLTGVLSGTLWVLAAPESFGKYCTMVIFAKSAILFQLLSRDCFFQVLYNLSLQIFVLLFMLVAGILTAEHFFDGNPWVDVGLRALGIGLLAFVYLKWFRKPFRKISDDLKTQWRGICIISVAGNALTLYYVTRPALLPLRGTREQILFFCICALLFLTHLVMLYTLYLMQREMEEKKEMELTALNASLLKRELSLMHKQVEETRRVRHDLRHHDLVVGEYVRRGETGALLAYLKQREDEYAGEAYERICENFTVNGILEAYVREARQKGIWVDVQAACSRQIKIRENDFIAILGNAMENAIHGCEEAGREEKRISVYLKQKQDKLAIRISNTCPEKISFQNGLPVRKDGGGIGISSILRSVKKYKGEADFTVESGEFVARILLQIPEKQAE